MWWTSRLNSRVPEGSVLGPLFFLIFVKWELLLIIPCSTLLSKSGYSAVSLNQDLETIRQWAYQWKLPFNPDPTNKLPSYCSLVKPISFNGTCVVRVDEHKYLDSKPSFHDQLNEKITKTKKTIGLIKHLSHILPIRTLIVMYKSLVRPYLDYCNVIFHSLPLADIHNPSPPLKTVRSILLWRRLKCPLLSSSCYNRYLEGSGK